MRDAVGAIAPVCLAIMLWMDMISVPVVAVALAVGSAGSAFQNPAFAISVLFSAQHLHAVSSDSGELSDRTSLRVTLRDYRFDVANGFRNIRRDKLLSRLTLVLSLLPTSPVLPRFSCGGRTYSP